jgi:hypothetical protein
LFTIKTKADITGNSRATTSKIPMAFYSRHDAPSYDVSREVAATDVSFYAFKKGSQVVHQAHVPAANNSKPTGYL